jgi:predicted protein tyrosine phosphatase
MALTISGYAWAKRHKRSFEAILTIEDPGTRFGVRFHRTPRPSHLVLQFVDLDLPLPAPFHLAPAYRMASLEQVTDALKFGRDHDNLLVHCQVGIARSPALALGILMDRLHDETLAYAELQRIRPEAVPNRHVVTLVDHILGSNLVGHLDAWDARNTWSLLRRKLCRRAYFIDGGIPLEANLVGLSPLQMSKPNRVDG